MAKYRKKPVSWQPTNEQEVCMTVAQGTPKTDQLKIPSEALLLLGSKGVPEQIVKAILILGDHASELERENAALSAQVVELQKELAQLNHIRNLGSMFEPPAGEGTA